MTVERKIEIYSAGCLVCQETIDLINKIACPSCKIEILNMQNSEVAQKAKQRGIKSIPAVAVNDKLADCCCGRGPTGEKLRATGIGIA